MLSVARSQRKWFVMPEVLFVFNLTVFSSQMPEAEPFEDPNDEVAEAVQR